MIPAAADQRFSPEVEAILRRAGWFEGRRFDLAIYDTFPMKPHAAAREVLSEFGGLHIGETGRGIDCARSDVDLRPEWTDRSFEGYEELDAAVGSVLYPLGETHRQNAYLLIDERGRVYEVMDDLMI